jgi:DNA-binding transcriptional LysR family regulator
MSAIRLTLRQLQVFVAVARAGSTNSAGADVALSQSATSSALNELERLLSLRLFDRAGKRLLLNDNGRALLPRALAVLDGAAGIEQMALRGTEQAQTLRIGASTTLGNYMLPPLLQQFLDARRIGSAGAWASKVSIGNTAAICDAVAGFELDIGLIEGPCHVASLSVTPWLQDELVIVASPALAALAPGERLPVKALREQVWLLREPGSGTRDATDHLLLPHLRSYRRSIELASSEAIKESAAEGLGVTCLSWCVVRDLVQLRRLQVVATTLPRLTRQCYWVVHRDKQPSLALREFIERISAAPPVAGVPEDDRAVPR